MINIFFVSYSLPAPFCRSLMLPPSRWRLLFKSCAFGHCYGVFLRAGVCVLLGSCAPARLGVSYGVRCAHPPRTALCVAPPLFRRGAGGRSFAGSRPSAFVALRRAGGRSQARIRAHPTLYKVIVHCLGSAVRRAPFGVLRSALLARSLAPLPRSRSSRVRPSVSLRARPRAPLCGQKTGLTYCRLTLRVLVRCRWSLPFRVSLYCICSLYY